MHKKQSLALLLCLYKINVETA